MGGVYRIQTLFGFLYFFLYLQGPLEIAKKNDCSSEQWANGIPANSDAFGDNWHI